MVPRSIFGCHFFISTPFGLISQYCGANGCYFDILELQVTKPHRSPPQKQLKMAILGPKMAIFNNFCHLWLVLLSFDLISLVLTKVRPLVHFDLQLWSRSNLAPNCKNKQIGYFEPKMVAFSLIEGVALGYITCHPSIQKQHPFSPQYKKKQPEVSKNEKMAATNSSRNHP